MSWWRGVRRLCIASARLWLRVAYQQKSPASLKLGIFLDQTTINSLERPPGQHIYATRNCK